MEHPGTPIIEMDTSDSVLSELYDYIKDYANSKSPDDNIKRFKMTLQKLTGKTLTRKDRGTTLMKEIDGLTLMQHCAKKGLVAFVHLLLGAGVNPNTVNPPNSKPSVLLAAESGNFEVLREFIEYNNEINRYESIKELTSQFSVGSENGNKNTDRSNGIESGTSGQHIALERLKATLEDNFIRCDFSRMTDHNETVLHLALQRPLIKKLKKNKPSKGIQEYNTWDLKKKACELDKKYKECIDVLINEYLVEENCNDHYKKQIRRIINIKDKYHGNTPLHYAVQNWPQGVVINLLSLGANMAVKNNNYERPLRRIQKETIEKFLNEKCMRPSRNESPMSREEDPEEGKSEELRGLLTDYDISKLLGDQSYESIIEFPIIFNFDFLAPAITAPTSSMNKMSYAEKVAEEELENPMKEMDILTTICTSKGLAMSSTLFVVCSNISILFYCYC